MKRMLYSIILCLSLALPQGQAKDISPKGLSTTYPTQYGQWQEALLSGNGKTGIMVFGNPYRETIVFNDRRFNFPSRQPRTFRTIPADTLARIKRLCADGRFKEANHLAASSAGWKEGGEGGRHPGYQLKIDLPTQDNPSGYLRYCDYGTGVVGVRWKDGQGEWLREAFVSRPDNMAVIRLQAPSHGKLNCAVSLSLDSAMNFPEGTSCQTSHRDGIPGIEVTYADTTLTYGGCMRAVLRGGRQYLRHDTLFIENADEALLLGRNFHHKGGVRTLEECRTTLAGEGTRYASLLKRHVQQHGTIYNRVRLSLHDGTATATDLGNEELLRLQESQDRPVAALWERIFNAGRYHFLSSSSEETPPDLLGIWTGDCNAGWGGFYHLDANLNLQVGGGNTGAMPEAMEGYFHLIEAWREDFELNARRLLGCRGMLAGGNSPGLSSGRMAAINEDYPYQYATGEMGWLLYPFWEYYLVTRDTDFLRQRLYPLLRSMGEFYEDFLTLKDSTGHYILAGSVSPENQPSNLPVSLLNNSAFDVSGARFLLSTLLKSCDILGEREEKSRWQPLLDGLPPYQVNRDGALKEWGWPGLEENYAHRHSSHLLTVWPYREISPHHDSMLHAAACEALAQKDRHSYGDAGHGFLHAAFIAAGLHQPASLQRKIIHLLQNGFYYSNLCTSHYGAHQVFCTDVAHAVPGIFIEMLVGSDEESIDLLPALPEGLEHGCVSGIKTRTGVRIDRLTWDMEKGEATAALTSRTDRSLRLHTTGEERSLTLKAGKTVEVKVRIGPKEGT